MIRISLNVSVQQAAERFGPLAVWTSRTFARDSVSRSFRFAKFRNWLVKVTKSSLRSSFAGRNIDSGRYD